LAGPVGIFSCCWRGRWRGRVGARATHATAAAGVFGHDRRVVDVGVRVAKAVVGPSNSVRRAVAIRAHKHTVVCAHRQGLAPTARRFVLVCTCTAWPSVAALQKRANCKRCKGQGRLDCARAHLGVDHRMLLPNGRRSYTTRTCWACCAAESVCAWEERDSRGGVSFEPRPRALFEHTRNTSWFEQQPRDRIRQRGN
jgi:hypothetical protein